MRTDIWYAVFDGRYRTHPDRALILSTADTLDEAHEDADSFIQGPIDHYPVIVKMVFSQKAGGYIAAGQIEPKSTKGGSPKAAPLP